MAEKTIKKARRRDQHRKAIKDFRQWAKENPCVTHGEKFAAFDMFVDESKDEKCHC